jgi:LmeA-like phospholipid-binding
VRKFLVVLLVLAVLLVAADFGLRIYAESRTATAVQTELGTTTAPDVSIEGFPFLLHAMQGEYPQVVITAANIDNGLLPGIRAVATLATVTLPLRDALAGDTSQLAAQGTTLQVLIPLSSLQAAVQPDLTLSAAPDGGLKATTTVTVAGQSFQVSGSADLTVADDTLTLSVKSLTAAGIDLTPVVSAAADALAATLTRSFALTGLPFTVTQAGVTVSGDDVVVSATTGPIHLADLK